MKTRKVVIVNQATKYLTIAIANEFQKKCDKVALITGSIEEQGEKLDPSIVVSFTSNFSRKVGKIKMLLLWLFLLFQVFYKLLFKFKDFEVVFIPNPPIASWVMLLLPHRFSIINWDVYPDGLKIMGIKESNLIFKVWVWINRKLFSKSYQIITRGNNIASLLSKYVDSNKISIALIWSNFGKFTAIPKSENLFLHENNVEGKFIIQYSGNIGLAHNVEVLLDVAERMQEDSNFSFQIIGDGNQKEFISRKLTDMSLTNCKLFPFQDDFMFKHSLSAADVGVVVLDDLISRVAVPSKIYNIMNMGIPILYIGSAESELKVYADSFENGRCFHKTQISEICDFLMELRSNKLLYKAMSQNSLSALKMFTRDNAEVLVRNYLNNTIVNKVTYSLQPTN